MKIERNLEKSIIKDLERRVVMIGGPRQVGKTTLAKLIADKSFPNNSKYLNWDEKEDKLKIVNYEIFGEEKLIILDEIHKMEGWKNWLKGLYDKYNDQYKFIVTGSANLDVRIKGGDSLFGRYHYYLLHPLSVSELVGITLDLKPFTSISFPTDDVRSTFENLFNFSGYPEPFIARDEQYWKRWQKERKTRVLKDDILSIKDISKLGKSELLADILPTKVASLFSASSIAEDLRVSPTTVESWMETFINFYYVFRIRPFNTSVVKSIRKTPIIYMWDWREVQEETTRFENMVASHLYKLASHINSTTGHEAKLQFLRDKESREVDFAFVVDSKIWFVVETKWKYKQISRHLKYFVEREKIDQAYQVVFEPGVDFKKDSIRVISADRFLAGLV